MATMKTSALVLKKTKLGETDLIITLLDETGIQRRAVAKSARKPGSFMSARLELFMLVELQLSTGRNLDIITDARILEAHAACRSDIEHSAAAALPAELIEKATAHHNEEPLLFAMMNAALGSIGEAQGLAPSMISLACLLKLSAALGVRPDVEALAKQNEVLAQWVNMLLNARFKELMVYSGSEHLPLLHDLGDYCAVWIAEHLEIKLRSLSFLQAML